MLTTIDTNASEKLREIEGRIRGLREERGRARKFAEAAKKVATQMDAGQPGFDAAVGSAKPAVTGVREMDRELEALHEEQVALLGEAGRPLGIIGAGSSDGWAMAAANLDPERSLRVNMAAASLLQAQAAPLLPRTPSSAPTPVLPPSNRNLFPIFETLPFPVGAETVATDFTASFSEAELTGGIVGEIERDPDQVSPAKAELTPTIGYATVTAKTYAVTLDAPARVFDSKDALRALLSGEMARQLRSRFDAAAVTALEAANPPSGSSGADLPAKIRNAVAAAHELGAEPQFLALTPSAAATLDLTQASGSGEYVFSVRTTSSASPIWNLIVREVPSINAPTLIDARRLAVVYVGEASVLADPYGENLKTNQISIRVEADAAFHVRDAVGAYVIA